MQLDKFKVSVIPVYNAEKYLRKAVESAVKIDSVGEIILVEDKSPDNALDLCKKLIEEYDKVKFFQHFDKGNHSAGALRNLGIQKASHDYIAFLDSDDYYLPNRFKKDKEIFLSNPMVESVYRAKGIHYYSEMAKKQFLDSGKPIFCIHNFMEERVFTKLKDKSSTKKLFPADKKVVYIPSAGSIIKGKRYVFEIIRRLSQVDSDTYFYLLGHIPEDLSYELLPFKDRIYAPGHIEWKRILCT